MAVCETGRRRRDGRKGIGKNTAGKERFLIFYREATTGRRRVILTGQRGGMIETGLVERIQAEGTRCWGKWVEEEEMGRPFQREKIELF